MLFERYIFKTKRASLPSESFLIIVSPQMLRQVAALLSHEEAAWKIAKQTFSIRKFVRIVMGRENLVEE